MSSPTVRVVTITPRYIDNEPTIVGSRVHDARGHTWFLTASGNWVAVRPNTHLSHDKPHATWQEIAAAGPVLLLAEGRDAA